MPLGTGQGFCVFDKLHTIVIFGRHISDYYWLLDGRSCTLRTSPHLRAPKEAGALSRSTFDNLSHNHLSIGCWKCSGYQVHISAQSLFGDRVGVGRSWSTFLHGNLIGTLFKGPCLSIQVTHLLADTPCDPSTHFCHRKSTCLYQNHCFSDCVHQTLKRRHEE